MNFHKPFEPDISLDAVSTFIPIKTPINEIKELSQLQKGNIKSEPEMMRSSLLTLKKKQVEKKVESDDQYEEDFEEYDEDFEEYVDD